MQLLIINNLQYVIKKKKIKLMRESVLIRVSKYTLS